MVDEDEKMNSEYYLDLTVIVEKTDNNHNLILDCSTMGNILCLDRIASLNNQAVISYEKDGTPKYTIP